MFVLTFDTDWAPQFVLDYVLERVRECRVKATVFCTSRYDFSSGVEIEAAIHPNFMSDSTQGNVEEEVVRRLKSWWPDAVGSRSHGLFWHSGLYGILSRHGIRYDCSQFLPLHPGLEKVSHCGLERFPIWWTDGLHLHRGLPLERFNVPGMEAPGLKVLIFHPIHIYLNTKEAGGHKEAIRRAGPLREAAPKDLAPFRNEGFGVESLFVSALEHIAARQKTCFLKELIHDHATA